ncbi:MAG: hypothetical protein KGL53_14145, partial [Elusimicrobia bacterium]|nr:hypothetical protein [Elusimicrobiota bacterium]
MDRVRNAEAARSTIAVGDYTPPVLTILSTGPYFVSRQPVLSAMVYDATAGPDTGTVSLSLDGTPIATSLQGLDGGGNLGAWQTGAPLRTPVTTGGLAYLNGRLYSIGGGGASGAIAEVDVGTLSGDEPVSWTPTASLPQPEAAPGIATLAGGLYVLGGFSSGGSGQATNVVYYARPDASSGLVSSWGIGPTLPYPLDFIDAVGLGVADSFLYAIGGRDATGTPHNYVYVTRVDQGSGAPLGWTAATPLPVPLEYAEAAQWNGRIYVLGGLTANDNAAVSVHVYSSAVDPTTGALDPAWRDE